MAVWLSGRRRPVVARKDKTHGSSNLSAVTYLLTGGENVP